MHKIGNDDIFVLLKSANKCSYISFDSIRHGKFKFV